MKQKLKHILLIVSLLMILSIEVKVIGIETVDANTTGVNDTTISQIKETEALETEMLITESGELSSEHDEAIENSTEAVENSIHEAEKSTEYEYSTEKITSESEEELTEESIETTQAPSIETPTTEPEVETTKIQTEPETEVSTEVPTTQVPTEKYEPEEIETEPLEYINLDNYSTVYTFGDLSENEYSLLTDILWEYQRYKNGEVNDVVVKKDFDMTDENRHKIESWFGIRTGHMPQESLMSYFTGPSYGTKAFLKIEKYEYYLAKRNEIMAMIEPILESFTEGNEQHKLLQISNWLASNITYSKDVYDPYTALISRNGSCNAYAQLFQLMASRLGITCDLCIGYSDTGRHAWNRVTFCNEGTGREYIYYDISYYHYGQNPKWINRAESPWATYAINNWWED